MGFQWAESAAVRLKSKRTCLDANEQNALARTRMSRRSWIFEKAGIVLRNLLVLCLLWTGTDAAADTRKTHELIGTLEHPFFSVDRDAFVPMAELEPGEQIRLLGDDVGVVLGSTMSQAAQGTSFNTFNIEVSDWH